jgi:hypothetical protein
VNERVVGGRRVSGEASEALGGKRVGEFVVGGRRMCARDLCGGFLRVTIGHTRDMNIKSAACKIYIHNLPVRRCTWRPLSAPLSRTGALWHLRGGAQPA